MIKNNLCNMGYRGLFVCLICLVLTVPVLAAKGQITVHDFALYQSDVPGKLVADVHFDYQLTDHLRDSLLNGLTLRSEISFELIFHREWWWNKVDRIDSVVNELKYDALTGQYQLVNRETDKNWNFSNLATALQHIGKLKSHPLPMLPKEALEKDADAAIYVEAILEPRVSKSLGIPEGLSDLFSKDSAKLISQGVMWPLTH